MDLVWISDSSGWDVAGFYARHIREDLGVAVRVRDKWEGDLTAVAVLERLRTRGHPWIRLIRNAEVIFRNRNSYGSEMVKEETASRPGVSGQRRSGRSYGSRTSRP